MYFTCMKCMCTTISKARIRSRWQNFRCEKQINLMLCNMESYMGSDPANGSYTSVKDTSPDQPQEL